MLPFSPSKRADGACSLSLPFLHMVVFIIPWLKGHCFGGSVCQRDQYKIIHYFICPVSGRGQMFITFIANELLSNDLVNSEPALIFLLKFFIC